jgi:hypothetical protein
MNHSYCFTYDSKFNVKLIIAGFSLNTPYDNPYSSFDKSEGFDAVSYYIVGQALVIYSYSFLTDSNSSLREPSTTNILKYLNRLINNPRA